MSKKSASPAAAGELANCQICGMRSLSAGLARDVHQPPVFRLKVFVSRQLGPQRKRAVKKAVVRLLGRLPQFGRREVADPPAGETLSLQVGDRVRVKSREEIAATLDHFHGLKGLVFMPAMWQYCGTEQRVHKPLMRFVDERELRVRKARGVILLEGLFCTGTPDYGPCDRSCFFFWREEWLEKIE